MKTATRRSRLGHYERFTHATLSRDKQLDHGRIYRNHPHQRRRGDFSARKSRSFPRHDEIKPPSKSSESVRCRNRRSGGTSATSSQLDPSSKPSVRWRRESAQRTRSSSTSLWFPHRRAGELKTKPNQHSRLRTCSESVSSRHFCCAEASPHPSDP